MVLDHSMSTPKDIFSSTLSSWRSASLPPQAFRSFSKSTGSKAFSCQGYRAQPCFSGLAGSRVSSFGAFTLPPAIHSSMSLVSSTALAHTGSWALGTRLACDKSELGPGATAEVLQPKSAPTPSAWGTDRRSWSPMCHRRVLILVE